MFKTGEWVIHPAYGAGIVTEIKETHTLGRAKRYYSIQLLGQPETIVMVPVGTAEEIGLRCPIPRSKLTRVWHILRSDPKTLPSKHDERYAVLKEKLHAGDVFKLAEVLRDLAWRREEKRRLTLRGKRLYDEGMMLLSSEIASAQGSDVDAAQDQILKTLSQSLYSSTVV